MLEALSAEALKLRGHKATWFLVWLYPLGFTLIFLIAIAVGIAGVDPPDRQSLPDWIEDTAVIWFVPGNSLGRYLIAGFVAVVFAGEYGWNTWKLIVPHRARSALIAAKYAAILILFAVAFTLTAIISIVGTWAEDVLTGDTIPTGITAALLFEAHGKGSLAALAPAFVTIGYASLAAVLTRSTIAALIIAIVATTVEQLVYAFGPVLSLRFPGVIDILYHGLPGYHLGNLASWINRGIALRTEFPGGDVVQLAWGTSLAAVAAWTVALVGATFFAFRRQDIN